MRAAYDVRRRLLVDGLRELGFGVPELPRGAFYVLADAGSEAKLLSKVSLGAPVYSSPVAANGTLFVASERFLWAVAKAAKP